MGLADGTAWENENKNVKILSGQGKMEITKDGSLRESNSGRGRFDLLPYEAIEALAKWYEAGASKYAERNWENGLSVKDCINRMIRHAMKAGNGWTDEDHLSAVMWNAAAAITMMQRRPDCNDHTWKSHDVIKQGSYVGTKFKKDAIKATAEYEDLAAKIYETEISNKKK